MLSSPRSPSSTTRIFSSAEKCRRVARRMSLTICSAGAFSGPGFCLIFAPDGYDDPEILRSRKPSICLTGADGGHLASFEQALQLEQPSDLGATALSALLKTDGIIGEVATLLARAAVHAIRTGAEHIDRHVVDACGHQ